MKSVEDERLFDLALQKRHVFAATATDVSIPDWNVDPAVAVETKGFVGERFDEAAGLQYLNARYYDPELGLFLQPDWFEGTAAGVGTNRYASSFNDPVNLSDPERNVAGVDDAAAAVGLTALICLTAAVEYGSDVLDDGKVNGTGFIGGATQGLIDGAASILESVFGSTSAEKLSKTEQSAKAITEPKCLIQNPTHDYNALRSCV